MVSGLSSLGRSRRAPPALILLLGLLCLTALPLYAQEDSLEVNPLNRKAAELLFGSKSGVREVTRVDYELGVAITTLEKNGAVLAVLEVMPLSEYIARSRKSGLRDAWDDVARKSISQREQEAEGGLIPNIELPDIVPGPIQGLIGQGGNLEVRGSQGIQFGGSKHFELDKQQTELTRESPFPELKMKQHLIVNLKGTVGQKVNVFVDHDSERETETKNKIKLQYQGDEDEIVQVIEAGDTDLRLPGTRLIGGPPTHKGLFGVKTMAKVGPLNVTAIASKEQGQSEEMTISGGALAETLKIDDIRYMRWRFFYGFIRTPPSDSVVGIQVFLDDGIGSNDDGTVYGEAFIDPRNPGDTADFYSGRFDVKLLADNFYTFDPQAGVLELNAGLEQNRDVLGVSYITAAGETVGTYKDFYEVSDSVAVQIIKTKAPLPTSVTWDYELKNVYSLGVSNLRPPVDLRVRKYSYSASEDPWIQGEKTFMELLGLDVNPQDGAIDVDRVRWDEGLLIFPDVLPFVAPLLADPDSIYDRTSFTDYSPKYYIELVAKGTKTTFNLNAINILEGSVQVKLNGRELTQGQDYTVDYQSGLVTLLTPEANRADANVTINYQYAPFLSLASKSLLGTRMDYRVSDKAGIGTSWMYRSVATKELRPRLGEESSRILVGEVDGHFDAEPYLFTRVADAFPLVSTDAASSLRLSAEAAVSLPNPSTQGVAFIDDMEGTKTSYSLGMTRPSWSYGSIPPGKDTLDFGWPYWFNPRDGIKASELEPNLPETRKNDQVTVLVLGSKRDSTYPGEEKWVSFNRSLSPDGIDFSKSKALEVWVKADDSSVGRLHIDIGTNIPEDAARKIPVGLRTGVRGINGTLDTEDVRTVNGELDYDEDVGIDTVAGVDDYTPVYGDDGNDDYYYAPGSDDYSRVNGTENNDRLDTEDLNGNYNLDSRADYFEFTIDLSSDAFVANESPDFRWRLYRMPLDDPSSFTASGNPDWENITAVRIWIDGLDQPYACTLAGLDIVGNKWRNGGVSGLLPDQGGVFQPEERIEISVKNNERDLDYEPPFDPGTDAYGNPRREQSLVIRFYDLESVHRGTAYQLISQKQDYSEYKEIRLWVHGDASEPTFFVKFGGDERNYYEYRCIATQGWQELVLPLQEFTDRKLAHQGETYYFDEGGLGYGFYGLPSFRNIMRMEVGVINQGSGSATGEIWVNEIRVTDPRKDAGTAGRVSLNTKFADLMGLNLDLSRVDSEFHGLTSERGSGQTKTTFSGTGNMSMGLFLPEKWGMSIPLSGSVTNELSLPKYQQSSDIVLTGDEASRRASHSTRRGASISLNKTKPSLNRLLKWTVDNIQVSSSVSQSFSDSETRIDSSAVYDARASYSYSPQLKPLSVFGLFGLGYFPKNFSLSTGYNKNWQAGYVKSDTTAVRTTSDENRTASGGAGFSYDPLAFVTSNYSIDAMRDLDLEGGALGSEIRRSQNAGVGFQLPVFSEYINQSANYETRYSEDHDPDIGGVENDYRNVTNSNTATTSATLNLSKFLSLIAKPGSAKGDSADGKPNWLVSRALTFVSRINPPKASYTKNRSSRYSFLKERPTWEYQFGLRDDLGDVEKDYYALDENSESNNYQANTGLTLGELTFNVAVKGSDSWKDYKGAKTRTESMTWPDLSTTLRSFERFLPMKRLVQSSELRSSYAVVYTESGPFSEPATSRSTSNSFSPLVAWRTSWQKRINSELSTNYSRTERESGTPVTTDTETRKGASATISYTFSAPGGLKLPLFGDRIKFKSNLDLSLTGSYQSTFSELVTAGSDKPPRTNADSESFSISSKANYNFSKSVTGGMRVEFAENKDKQRGRTGRDINVEFDVLFKF